MIKVLNDQNVEVNVLHFQGKSLNSLQKTFQTIYQNAELESIDKDLTIISCWTNERDCYLYKQFKKNNLNLINAIPDNYNTNQYWDMTSKIKFYVKTLETRPKTKYVMLVDGYDVVFSSTSKIIDKFENMGYKIIFNTSYNNFPDEFIDYIENRDKLGFFKYFNAGCCIGYWDDVLKFYKECLQFINSPNPLGSEQKIIRMGFAKYSSDRTQKFIWVDYKREIFHTMALVKVKYDNEKNTIHITNNVDGTKQIIFLNSKINKY